MKKPKDCQTCAYRQYLTNETSMCSHKHIQTKIAEMGIVEMKKKDFIKLCPGHCQARNPQMVGWTKPSPLRYHFNGAGKLKQKKESPSKQSSLF